MGKRKWCESCKRMFDIDHFYEYKATNGKTWLKCTINYNKYKDKRRKDFDKVDISTRPTINKKYIPFSEEYSREVFFIKKYGITLDNYNEMLTIQDGKCKICKTIPLDNLCVDHCHETGKVRGLLCSRCNFAIGQFKDNEELILKAINYLKYYIHGTKSV